MQVMYHGDEFVLPIIRKWVMERAPYSSCGRSCRFGSFADAARQFVAAGICGSPPAESQALGSTCAPHSQCCSGPLQVFESESDERLHAQSDLRVGLSD